MIGIIGAMQSETELLCKSIKDCVEIKVKSYSFYKGTINNQKIVIVKSGIGKVNSAIVTQLLIHLFAPEIIINTGIAGSTNKELNIYDFAVAEATVYHDVDATFFGYEKGQVPQMPLKYNSDKRLQVLFESVLKQDNQKYKLGLIASGDSFVSNKEQKSLIKKQFNPLCVDMESCSIAQVCFINNVPFITIRCISDTADENGTKEYTFNENVCAEKCADLVKRLIGYFGD